MRKQQLIYFIFFSLFLNLLSAQDFDESFLESLPSGVKEDLLNQTSSKKAEESIQYRRPSTYIIKPDTDNVTDRFGSNIFSMMQTTLMPINEPNFDGSYILDFGDVLELQLVGEESSIQKIPIKRDGSVNIDEIGKIYVSGLSLETASDLIKSKVNNSYIGVDAFITLINIRDIQVFVSGNVYNPGLYTLNGNSNIFHALSVSGGPSSEGSFRSIKLLRDNETIEKVDLYDTFIMGKSSFNKTRLRSGDLIFVDPIFNLVNISGGIKRPGTYELKSSETIASLIFYANGLSNKADLSQINLFRLENGTVKIKEIKEIRELSSLKSEDNDKLVIRTFPYRTINIQGAIKNPGSYILNEGDGILELINQAGGYNETAYPFGGVLQNLRTQEINAMANEELYSNFLISLSNNLMSAQASSQSDTSNFALLMDELKNMKPSGRVSAEFNLSILENDPAKDINLQNGDSVIIPEFLDHVYIYGEVASEGTVRFSEGKDPFYYVNKKGGYTTNADPQSIFILHPNGETVSLSSSRKNFFIGSRSSINIYPGSVIFIPRSTTTPAFRAQAAQAYATILGNIGVSLASISVLKD